MISAVPSAFIIRKLIHLVTGLGFVFIASDLQTIKIILGLIVLFTLILDVGRHFVPAWNKIFLLILGKCLKVSEQQGRLTGATGLWLGLYVSFLCFPLITFQTAASVVVVADPLAALGGKLIPSPVIRKTKSLVGTAIFMGTSIILLKQYWNIPLFSTLYLSIILGLLELFSPESIENIIVSVGGTLVVYIYYLMT